MGRIDDSRDVQDQRPEQVQRLDEEIIRKLPNELRSAARMINSNKRLLRQKINCRRELTDTEQATFESIINDLKTNLPDPPKYPSNVHKAYALAKKHSQTDGQISGQEFQIPQANAYRSSFDKLKNNYEKLEETILKKYFKIYSEILKVQIKNLTLASVSYGLCRTLGSLNTFTFRQSSKKEIIEILKKDSDFKSQIKIIYINYTVLTAINTMANKKYISQIKSIEIFFQKNFGDILGHIQNLNKTMALGNLNSEIDNITISTIYHNILRTKYTFEQIIYIYSYYIACIDYTKFYQLLFSKTVLSNKSRFSTNTISILKQDIATLQSAINTYDNAVKYLKKFHKKLGEVRKYLFDRTLKKAKFTLDDLPSCSKSAKSTLNIIKETYATLSKNQKYGEIGPLFKNNIAQLNKKFYELLTRSENFFTLLTKEKKLNDLNGSFVEFNSQIPFMIRNIFNIDNLQKLFPPFYPSKPNFFKDNVQAAMFFFNQDQQVDKAIHTVALSDHCLNFSSQMNKCRSEISTCTSSIKKLIDQNYSLGKQLGNVMWEVLPYIIVLAGILSGMGAIKMPDMQNNDYQ